MKTADVKIGERYLCRVGERLVTVVVTERHPGTMRNSGRRSPDTFTVHRVGEQKYLPKLRTAAALRPVPEVSVQEAQTALVNTLEGMPEKPIIGAVQTSSLEELEALPHEPLIIEDAYDQIDVNALRNGLGIPTPSESTPETVRSYCLRDSQRTADLAHTLQPHKTIVSQENYFSAAENCVGWCTTCQAFRGENLKPDSRECKCPECHQHTLYSAVMALSEDLIDPQGDD